ncbi:MAG: VanZ family protein [Armatimonadetes bacterium]|nr:hypothetical protein [Armatimonadota bacterium]NOG92462.1 VanZ family protein [Armatimonadota bacterium]
MTASAVIRYPTYLLTAAWWSLVLFSSGEGAGAGWTRRLLRWLLGLEGEALDTANLIVRKAAHVVYYAVLTVLLARSLSLALRKPALPVAAGLALATGACDEWRQSHFGSRTGTAWDLLYDGAGILLVVAYCCWTRARTK